jgi:diguanylate cyclase (GGDEF)-like protein
MELVTRLANGDPRVMTDHLSGLPDRRSFFATLTAEISRASARKSRFALALLDLDKLRRTNELFGYAAGDEVIRVISARLRAALGTGGYVVRSAGDEFALIVPLGGDGKTETEVLGICREALKPIDIGKYSVQCRANIGVAVYPDDERDPVNLLKDADVALGFAKSNGSSGLVCYSPNLRLCSTVMDRARRALASDGIVPYYQPKVSLASGLTTGFEALLRWVRGTDDIQLAETFSDAFDDAQLSTDLGDRILQYVASDIQRWLREGAPFGRVAINISAAAFSRPELAANVLTVIDAEGIGPECLEIEVTEKVFLDDNSQQIARELHKLHERGVRISLDDFGTGYASLMHLRQFPVDCLKIDRSFVRDIEFDKDCRSIVLAILNLAQSLNKSTVAVGVETEEQARFLMANGCEAAQGYLFSPAMPADRVVSYVRSVASQAVITSFVSPCDLVI